MSIEEVLKKTKIEFKSPLDLEQLDELFKYLAINLKLTIASLTKINKRFDGVQEESKDNILGIPTSIYINGGITGLEYDTNGKPELLGPDTFKCESNSDAPVLRFKELQFRVISHDIHKCGKSHTRLWDKIREYTDKFFKEKYKSR